MEDLKNTNSTYDKGITLLKNSLKRYEEGDFEGGDKDRKLANELLDKSHFEEESKYNDDILYGENRNFGIINNVIVENVKNIYKNKQNLKPVGKILKYIKNTPLLKEQFEIYTSLENAETSDVETYLNEAIKILPTLNKKEVINENKKLIQMIRDCNLDECIAIPEAKINLYEAIEFFLTNQKNLSNIDNFNLNKNIIKEYIEKIKNTISVNESEENLIKELNEGNKENVFNRYKTETVNMISNQLSLAENINDKLDWNNMLTRVLIKQFDEKRILEDIKNFIDIQNIINE